MKEQRGDDLARHLAAVIDTAIDGIITIDAQGVIESYNKAAEALFGYPAEEVIGQNVKVLMPEPDRSQHDGYIHRYHETGQPRIIGIGRDVKGRRTDGSTFPMRLAVSKVILNDRIVFTGIVHDLSALKEAETRLKEINSKLEHKVEERTYELEAAVNRLLATNTQLEESQEKLRVSLEKEKELGELKSKFVSLASHEFRTPLASILSSAAIIDKYEKTDQQHKRSKHTDRIKSAVANLTGILNDFLSLSKLEENVINYQPDMHDVVDILADAVEGVDGIRKEHQQIEIDATGPCVMSTDGRILKNVFFNLISNAIKYSDDDIICRVRNEGDAVSISIIDQGIGIPEVDQKHLFSRFYRAGNVSNIQGTGLGLNIVKKYVDILGGSISYDSTEDVGTTFVVLIPH